MGVQKRWPAQLKLKILKEAQQSGATISEVCRRHGISTTHFYKWQKQADAGALGALSGRPGGSTKNATNREEQLRAELQRMKGVVAEITAENLELKKTLGD